MDGFMVLLGCCLDDVPVRLCETRDEAMAVVAQIREQGEDGQIIQDALGDWFTDASVVLAVNLVTFTNGRVSDTEHCFSFDELEEAT